MSDFPELEMLVDAFPNYPRSELASRLLCSASAEVLFNELLAETADSSEANEKGVSGKVFSSDVGRLKDLFPSAHRDNLAAALHSNNGCIDTTIEQMLEHDPVQKLVEITGLPEADCRPYIARNKDDVLRSLADIISHYKKRKKVRVSRVQSSAATSATYQDAYILRENSAELLQLKECVWAEPALQALNYDFLLKSLVFFQGDVPRVLDITRLYIEASCESITFDHRLGFQHKEVPQNTLPSSSILRSASPSLVSPRPLGPKLGQPSQSSRKSSPLGYVSNSYNSTIRDKSPLSLGAKSSLINNSRSKTPIHLAQPNHQKVTPKKPVTYTINSSSRLDLHGFTVSDASVMVKQAVSNWWAEEKEARASEGHIERYGSRAEFVEPLQIITGRGIHSAGGAPKIRSSVIKLLGQEGYLIDENVGSVAVYGKKPKRK